MKLGSDYDSEADILHVCTGRQRSSVMVFEVAALNDIGVELADDAGIEIVGLLAIGASHYVAPYFSASRKDSPAKAGNRQHTTYDRQTDTLTWGVTQAERELISQAGDIFAYWQPGSAVEDSFFGLIGVSLRNASRHLAPWFQPIEPQ